MPLVEITLTEGRSEESIRGVMGAVHDAVVASLGVREQAVRVVVREVPPQRWLSGGVTIAERDGI